MNEMNEFFSNSIKLFQYGRELADRFKVSESTVDRWASGATIPHPIAQMLILKEVKKINKKNE